METITVLPTGPGSAKPFLAIAGDEQAAGSTVGQAIDELRAKLTGPPETTLVIVQPMTPDRFFTAEQRDRLSGLMAKWRESQDSGSVFPPEERVELEDLIQAELAASAHRAAALLRASPS